MTLKRREAISNQDNDSVPKHSLCIFFAIWDMIAITKGGYKNPMFTRTFYSIICLMFTFSFLSQSIVNAETDKNEKQIVVDEIKTYKDTEITLKYLLIDRNKTTLQILLHGEQVKDLTIKKKGDIYVHTTPRVMVFDDKGQPLKQGAIKEDEPDKGQMIEGRMHNISEDTIEITNYYKTTEELPEFLTIKIMEFKKGNNPKNNSAIAEFKVDL